VLVSTGSVYVPSVWSDSQMTVVTVASRQRVALITGWFVLACAGSNGLTLPARLAGQRVTLLTPWGCWTVQAACRGRGSRSKQGGVLMAKLALEDGASLVPGTTSMCRLRSRRSGEDGH
jgi:hypothetical protein